MFYLFVLLFIMLSAALLSSVFKSGTLKFSGRMFRIFVVLFTGAVFAYYFISRSLPQFRENALTVQIINTLPFPLDFYIVRVDTPEGSAKIYETVHLGDIRSDHYRIEYLDMMNSDEFWVAGFLGPKNMVYFSQHLIPNKNEDQVIEIDNYTNDNQALSETAAGLVDTLKFDNMKTAIWITLDLLLLFLNFTLLVRRPKKNPNV